MVSVPDDAARTAGNYAIANADALDDTNDILSIPISASNSSGSVELLVTPEGIFGDAAYNSPVEIPLGIASGSALAGLGTKITILDDKSLPALKISVDMESIEEGDPDVTTAETITVSAMLDLGTDGGTLGTAVSVTIEITENDAFYTLGGLDADGNLVITGVQDATAQTGTFTITPVRDTIFEAHQTITLKATATLIAGDDDTKREATATVTLEDDDHEVTLAIDPTSVSEDGGTEEITVTATLTDDRRSDIAIPVIISQSSAYYSLSASAIEIEIDAGDTTGDETFEITPDDNETYNGNQRITISVDGTKSDLVLRDTAVLTLEDDEGLPDLVLSVSPSMISEGGGGERVMVTATLEDGVLIPTTTTVAVEVAEDDDQYSLSSNALTIQIPANATTGQGSITITPVDDILFEAHQAITFTATAELVAGDDDAERETTATVTLQDDDQEVTLSLSRSEVPELGGDHDVVVTAKLVRPSPIDVMVEVRIPSQTEQDDNMYNLSIDGTTAADTFNIMIEAGDSSGMATLTVTPTYSPAYSGSKTITLSGRAVRGATILIRDNEEIKVQLATSIASMTEDGGSQDVEITASLDGRLVNALNITLSLEGEADRGDDYTVSGEMVIEIGSGSTSGSTTLTFTPVDDLLYENNETITVAGNSSGNQSVSSTEITLNDNNSVPLASVVVNPISIGEGDGPTQMTIRANLAGTSGEDILIGLSKPGDAEIGIDFTVEVDDSAGDFIVAAGNNSATKTVTIVPVDDEIYELDETFRVVTTASLRDSGTRIAGSKSAEVTLVDNDPLPMITMSVDPVSVSEDGGDQLVTITATSDRESSMDIPVALSKSGTAGLEGTESANADIPGSVDYAISVAEDAGDLMVAAGEMSGSKEITITPVDDEIYEGDETIMVNGTIMDSEGGEVAAESAALTLTDDEVMPTFALSVDDNEITEDGGDQNVIVTATASGLSSMDIVVSLTKSGTATKGEDYTPAGTPEITVAALEMSGETILVFTPTNDDVYENSEIIEIGGEGAEITAMASITLVDDETMPTFALSVDPDTIAEEGGAVDVTVTATASGLSSMPIAVTLTKAGTATKGEDYIPEGSPEITVEAMEMSGMTTLTITPSDDSVYENDETIVISGEGAEITQMAVITLVDDETKPMVKLSAGPGTVPSVTEEGGAQTVTITATSTGLSSMPIEVGLSLSGTATSPDDFEATGDLMVTIDPGKTVNSVDLVITPVDDDIYELDESIVVEGVVNGGDEMAESVELTLVDNDPMPTVDISVDVMSITEDGGPQDVVVTGTANGRSSLPLVYELTKSGTATKGEDYVPSGNPEITVAPLEYTGSTTLTIEPVDDEVYEQDETIIISGGDGEPVTLTLVDNEVMPTFALSVDNDSIMEDGGAQDVTVTATASGLASMPLTVALTKSGTATKGEDYTPTGNPEITVEPLRCRARRR